MFHGLSVGGLFEPLLLASNEAFLRSFEFFYHATPPLQSRVSDPVFDQKTGSEALYLEGR